MNQHAPRAAIATSQSSSAALPPIAQPMPRQFVLLLHAGYWTMYTLLLLLMFRIVSVSNKNAPSVVALLFTTRVGFLMFAPNVAAFYVEYALLVPRFLARRRFPALLLASVATAIVCSALCAFMLFIIQNGGTVSNATAANFAAPVAWLSLLALVHMTIAMVIRGFISWYDDIAVKEELTQKNAVVEAALVRAKLDPHFLFNTLNNLDVLVLRDAAAASQYLGKLSDILRYVLYETQGPRVSLDAELAYLDKYVALQRIRTTNANFVDYTLNGDTSDWEIAPMLLIPFVENAFKHASGQRADGAIRIALESCEKQLVFECSNRYQRGSIDVAHAGGIGRQLMERRLALLYPGKHTLEFSDNGSLYAVHLTISLDDNALHHR